MEADLAIPTGTAPQNFVEPSDLNIMEISDLKYVEPTIETEEPTANEDFEAVDFQQKQDYGDVDIQLKEEHEAVNLKDIQEHEAVNLKDIQEHEAVNLKDIQEHENVNLKDKQEHAVVNLKDIQEHETEDFESIQEQEAVDIQNMQQAKEDFVAEGGEKRWSGWPGDNVFRLLVPSPKVGGIIGRKGENIKKVCEETKSRVKILDGPPGARERAVIVSAKEDLSASISPAMNGLLQVLKSVVDVLDEDANGPSQDQNVVTSRLLVTAIQAKSLIGKQGLNIKYIQESSSSVVRILDEVPPFALPDDRVVEIHGERSGVFRAVELVAGQLRKYLVDRTVIPLFEMQMCAPNMHMDYNRKPAQPWAHPQDLVLHSSSDSFGNNRPPMRPYSHDNHNPPSDFTTSQSWSHHADAAAYGRGVSHIGAYSAPNDQGPTITGQLTKYMQVPMGYADAVIGVSGATISYIRRTSGATITVQETRGLPEEMTVEINGSASQVQTAQQMIQNFMADAATPAKPSEAPVDHGYSSYPGQAATYMSSANAGVPTKPTGDDYAYAYGASYGY